MAVKLKRVYDAPEKTDGYRVLVDRLWPRGVSKANAKLDLWLKEVGPSDELRKWFGHDPTKFSEFEKRYRKELMANPAAEKLRQLAKEHDPLTLVYGAKDEKYNQAVVLKNFLK